MSVREFTSIRKLLRGGGLYSAGASAPKEPNTVLDLLDDRFSQEYFDILPWSKQNFDVNYDEFNLNVFNSYIRYLDTPEWTTFVTVPTEVASDLAYKPGLISRVIYGTTVLQYLIYAFNDIREPSDLTEDFLIKKGVKALNKTGLEKLQALISFKQAEENKRINTFKMVVR